MSNQMVATIFMYMGLLVGLSYRMSPNEICKEFMNGVKSMCGTAMMIGFAYVISVILTKGQVLDTIVNFLAGILIYVPKLIQAPLMFYAHIIINLFITSGSGQAATTMPIFVPVAEPGKGYLLLQKAILHCPSLSEPESGKAVDTAG